MHESDRVKLLYGPYLAPRCKMGDWLTCKVQGKVRVCATSNAPIPWPMTHPDRGGKPAFILCGDLVRAVRRESWVAVCHHWGVTPTTVRKWRRAIGQQ